MVLPLRSIALKLSRLPIGGLVVAALARWLPGVLPFRVAVLPHMVLLRHPVPSAKVHLLGIPRRMVRDVTTPDPRVGAFWSDLEDWAATDGAGYGVAAGITNVGARQDVRLLHVHLVSDLPSSWGAEPHWSGLTLPHVMARLRDQFDDHDAQRSGSFGFMLTDCTNVEVRFDEA